MRPSATTTEPIGTSPSSAAARASARASAMNVSSSDLKDHLRRKLAGPAGFEPAAFGFVVRRSIQLSYGPFSSLLALLCGDGGEGGIRTLDTALGRILV